MSFIPFWVHLGRFGCLKKIGAKRSELVQNFVPRNCIRIFRNERTRSTPLDPKLMFWCVSYRLGAFGTVRLPYEARCKMGRTSEKVYATKSHLNFFQRKHPVHSIGPLNSWFGEFRTIWVHLGRFGCLKKLGAKRSELVQNFVPRNHIRNFRNERTRSTPLDPKLMFWCVSYRLGAFGTVRLPYETRGKTGRTNAKVYATKSHWNFSQRNHPIHFIGP